jgi:hypothetical protein
MDPLINQKRQGNSYTFTFSVSSANFLQNWFKPTKAKKLFKVLQTSGELETKIGDYIYRFTKD